MEINKIRPFDVPGNIQDPITPPPLLEKVKKSQEINKDENPERRRKKREEEYKKVQEEREKKENLGTYNSEGKKNNTDNTAGDNLDVVA